MSGQLDVVLLGKIWGKWLEHNNHRIQGQIAELLGVQVNDIVQLYQIEEGDFFDEIIKQQFPIRQSDDDDSLRASLLYELNVLEVMVVDEEQQGFQDVEIALLL